ncbi:hypothetical protein [Cellvibrio sp. BR]|uniref:hypothetical protein n=1 Tax=Cellvibrio sp. BR TaxID=1134474 RepID=UPI0012F4D486
MVQITSDIELSGAGCTTAITPNQLVQSSSENDMMQLAPWMTGSIWAIALSWMGYACLRNARQCGRMHCFFSGPFFLGSAMLALGIGMQWIQWLTFNGLGLFLLIGTPLVCVLPEMFWGTYKVATNGKEE